MAGGYAGQFKLDTSNPSSFFAGSRPSKGRTLGKGVMLMMTGAKPLQISCFEESSFVVKTDPEAVKAIDAAQQIEPYTQIL